MQRPSAARLAHAEREPTCRLPRALSSGAHRFTFHPRPIQIQSRAVPILPGGRLDRYTLVAPVGAGGQAAVWRVTDPLCSDGDRVVKLVKLSDVPAAHAERVRLEARTLAKLAHPSLVACHALFEDLQENVLGLVMDEVRGWSLEALLFDPQLTSFHREALLDHLYAVLEYVHAQGTVHRDVKPGNILVTQAFLDDPSRADGIKLVDFGIAIGGGKAQRLTQVGCTPGTLPFMPPEHIDPSYWGAMPSVPATDVWAFGVLGWMLLGGGHPSGQDDDASQVDLASRYRAAALGQSPWPIGTVGGRWESRLRRCLCLRAEDRPRHCGSLSAIASGAPSSTTQQHAEPSPSSFGPGFTDPMAAGAPFLMRTVPQPPSVSTPDTLRSGAGPLAPSKAGRLPTALGLGAALLVLSALGLAGAFIVLRGTHSGKGSEGATDGSAPSSPIPSVQRTKLEGPDGGPSPSSAEKRRAPVSVRPAPIPASSGDAGLGGPSCGPCCGGSTCFARPRADRKLPPGCSALGKLCAECSSRFRTCVPQRCDDVLAPKKRWKFRASSVANPGGKALWHSDPDAQVCMELAGSTEGPECFSANATFRRAGATCNHRMGVSTEDVTSGRLHVWIDSPGRPRAEVLLTQEGGLHGVALCQGVVSNVSEAWAKSFSWFLDPEDDSDSDCLREERARWHERGEPEY